MRIQQNHQRGSVLVTTLIMSGLVMILVAAILTVVRHQHYLTVRSTTWCSEIPIAEAGIEEAMAHISSRPRRLWTNGWTQSGSNVVKTRYFTNTPGTALDGYFYAAISTSTPPTITSIGYGRIPLAKGDSDTNNYTRRSVFVTTKANPPPYGIVAKTTITLNGSGSDWPWIDSYDSSNPDYSTGGQYDPLKRRDQAGVATLSTATPAIVTGSGEIWGFATTGPGGTVTGTVGDGNWNITTSGLQPGHVRDDYNMAIPDVSEPTTTTGWNPFPGSRILGTKDYKLNGDLTVGFTVPPNLHPRLWVTGSVAIGGGDAVNIGAGASIEIFVGTTSGPDVSANFGGNGIINGTNSAASCKIWGLPSCKDMKYSGNVALTAVIYAPQADVRIVGGSDIYGSFTGRSFSCNGSIGIHQDEALVAVKGAPYTIISWEEL